MLHVYDVFEYDCATMVDHVQQLCALHESEIHMCPARRVTLDEASKTFYDVTGYSETYHAHPHTLLATATSWKTNPSRADLITGKSSTVMKARRNSIRTSMKPAVARKTQLNILAEYQKLQAALSTHQSPLQGSTPLGGEGSYNCLDIDMDASNIMDVDMTDHRDIDGANMLSCVRGTIFSTRTKPVAKNRYQKRLGAKKAKKLELDDRSDFTLNAADATMYRARSARCNYLMQDQPDIAFSTKE